MRGWSESCLYTYRLHTCGASLPLHTPKQRVRVSQPHKLTPTAPQYATAPQSQPSGVERRVADGFDGEPADEAPTTRSWASNMSRRSLAPKSVSERWGKDGRRWAGLRTYNPFHGMPASPIASRSAGRYAFSAQASEPFFAT